MANTQTAVKSKTNKLLLLVLSALFAAMITVMTAFLFHIPIGVNGGYLHFGDALIYLAASMLPTPYACIGYRFRRADLGAVYACDQSVHRAAFYR